MLLKTLGDFDNYKPAILAPLRWYRHHVDVQVGADLLLLAMAQTPERKDLTEAAQRIRENLDSR